MWRPWYNARNTSRTRRGGGAVIAQPRDNHHNDHLPNRPRADRRQQRRHCRARGGRPVIRPRQAGPVVVTIDGGYTYKTTIGVMGGRYLVSFNAETRKNTGRGARDDVEVDLVVDPDR
ncbi:MAG TPA: DUF1905 domain-containing protein [Kineosporiaceae bacterium]|nr:DUF1905 domain-containing protein [Kineosporiaceae bacterium]